MAKIGRPGMAFAKTTRPAIGSAIDRAALFAHLDGPPGRTVLWISGPPGSGKTTLAASYVQARRLKSVWFQLDADDGDPAGFFHYLGHAARGVVGIGARALPVFTAHHALDVAAFARKFFRELFAGATEPLALILDNATPVQSALAIALDAGFSQVPKGCCVIVTSRSEPPASLARLRASGQMCCVGGADLRLGPDEIVMLAAARGQIVSPEAAAKLYERTHGWAAGLVLMLEHSKFSGRIADVPAGAAPQVIFDYLAGEIFDRFESDTRDFLLRIACLPRMTTAVATTLSSNPNAERLLVNLARNDYFVREASSETGRIYQIHPLLREFLRQRATIALPEASSAAWLRRAAVLLHEARQTEDAVALLIEASDWPEVARIALEETDLLLAQGRSETLSAWLDLLPPKLIDADPRLLLTSATARALASPRTARQLFERAFERFRSARDTAGMIRSCCGIIDAIIGEFDDVATIDRWLEMLDGLLEEGIPVSGGQLDVAAATTLARAMLLRDGGNARIEHWLDRADHAIEAAAERSSPRGREELALARALSALARADLVAAESVIDGLRPRVAELSPSAARRFAIASSLLRLVGGAYGDALRIAEGAVAPGDIEGVDSNDGWLRAISAFASVCSGDSAAAADAVQRLASHDSELRRGDRACVHYLRAWLFARADDTVSAHRSAKSALSVAIETGIPWFECLARILLARLHARSTDSRGAEAQLRGALTLAERLGSPWLHYAVDLVAATIAREARDERVALKHIRNAFQLGHEHGFRQPPGASPQDLAELCAIALDAEVEPDFARALVRDGKFVPRAPPLLVPRWPWLFRFVTFGAFECQRADALIELSGKGPGRPMELLKVLIALGPHNVRTDQLADALWPHMEADYAYKSFTTTLHRLRRSLEDEDAVVLRDGRLSLNKALVWVDTWALEQLLDDCDARLRNDDAGDSEALLRKLTDAVLTLYRGPFLSDESEQPSYLACREQIRGRMSRFLARVARGWEEAGAPEIAAECYLRVIEVDELCEPLYRQLMLCFQRNGAHVDALTTYERLRTILSMRLKTMPSPETQALYASLRSSGNAATAR